VRAHPLGGIDVGADHHVDVALARELAQHLGEGRVHLDRDRGAVEVPPHLGVLRGLERQQGRGLDRERGRQQDGDHRPFLQRSGFRLETQR
jgi:hypothetical protein